MLRKKLYDVLEHFQPPLNSQELVYTLARVLVYAAAERGINGLEVCVMLGEEVSRQGTIDISVMPVEAVTDEMEEEMNLLSTANGVSVRLYLTGGPDVLMT